MAKIDSLDILCDHQEITTTDYSQKAKPISVHNAPTDWGEGGMQRYVTVLAHGAFTAGASLMVNLMGFNLDKPEIKSVSDMKDLTVIFSSGAIPAADIVEGWRCNIPISTIGKKYNYICLQFIPAGSRAASAECLDDMIEPAEGEEGIATAADDADTDTDTLLCPTAPVLEIPDPAENTFTAWITVGIDSTLTYPYVNEENYTA